MQLHEIKPIHKLKEKKRVGRGGKRGTYSGKGIKGQKSRAGKNIRPAWRDLLKQIPKLRGFKFKSIQTKPFVVNLSDLESNFKNGDRVTPDVLLSKGLIKKRGGKMPEVKILGNGNLTKKLLISECQMSVSVREKLKISDKKD